ncbi:hypothetical protein WT83_27045 [Burkholderia territorii]|uniref:Uncharacterized protein n=2 Tax=Burkholderia territorii TaxID=1503055 RepID=A0A108E7X2_9BURK|nr:hypothetical protein WT83_27045 [Burkholderia territorii]
MNASLLTFTSPVGRLLEERPMKHQPKTFMVADANRSRTLVARQLATFAHYLEGIQFRFVVTQLPNDQVRLTHRATGTALTTVEWITLSACRGDHKDAGIHALKELIERVGEARIASVLREAEAGVPAGNTPAAG